MAKKGEQGRYPENRNSEGYADPTYYGGTRYDRRREWSETLQAAERASETGEQIETLKRRNDRLLKARNVYRDRCAAWEQALEDLDAMYFRQLRAETDGELDELQSSATAYGLAIACAVLRRRVEGEYEDAPRKIARKMLNAKQVNASQRALADALRKRKRK